MKNDFPRLEVSDSLRRRMVEVAREFRKQPTDSERNLWQALRGKKLDGLKFRRQQPVGLFVVDFYAELVEKKLEAALEMIRSKIRELESLKAVSLSLTSGKDEGGGK